jgi:pimeloyl-ACP methyl ester carboxylesterase
VTRRAVAVVAALGLLLAGCSTPTKTQVPVTATSAPTDEEAEPGLESFYAQPIEWAQCDDFQCATAAVPIDYADPGAGSLELALRRAPATGESLGSLLINPGGPGASGVDFVEAAVETFTPRLLERYDVVGFDPRGVGRSSPVTCLDPAAKDELISRDFDFTTDEGILEAQAAYGELGDACAAGTGAPLGHVDTASAARDMDVLRAAVGDEGLNYLGFSYGTALGATYASLFPERSGRLVLDGAIDPSLDSSEVEVQQAVGFENALRAYVENCQAGTECPLTGSVDEGLQQVHDLVERARRSPLATGTDRALTGTLAFYGIAVTLYDEESWPVLTQALTAAIRQDDGNVLLSLADFYNDRNEDGTFATNSTEAFLAVNCLDGRSPSEPADIRASMAELIAAAPTVGEYFSYESGVVKCAQWPVPAVEDPVPIAAEGAPPIVVIGTTNDPATPYAWAEGLAEQLSSGVLLTYVGEGHTAYGRSNDCIAGAVDAYLIQGTVPADGMRC